YAKIEAIKHYVRFIILPTRIIQQPHSSRFRARCPLSPLLIVITNLCCQQIFAYFAYFLTKTKRRPFNVSSSITLYRD
ncbi:hypothetical protein COCVIDRAFT_91037, partial [Bipolaris victoriae FI3]